MKRREFIKSSVALTAAAGISSVETAAAAEKAKVRSYHKLGNTDLKISDISMGCGKGPAPSLILRAIDRGINYFDTAPDYGNSEENIGKALKRFKQRDKIYIASKFCDQGVYLPGMSHLDEDADKAQYKAAVEASLKRLNTDYLDVAFVHAIGERKGYEKERSRLNHEEMLSAADELKQEGKIRYLAVSSHGPNNMERLLLEAVRSGHYDLIMPSFNFMKFPKMPQVLREAHGRGVGVVAMKTLAGAKEMELQPGDSVFEHAAFKWVLQHKEVAGLVVTMKKVKDIELYLQASGQEMTAADQRTLERYAALYGNDYCRTGCGDCEGRCPAGVPVASIMRYQMYFDGYGEEKRAMQSYAGLERNATACLDCAVESCTGGCEHGLPVAEKLRAAHQALSFEAVA